MPPKMGSNPVDSYRKAQKKQDIKKGKEGKSDKADKNAKLAYKDTFLLEIEIKSLEERSGREELDKNLSAHFTQLKEELEQITKAKAAFVEEHPEKKSDVYRNLSAPSAQAQAALARRRDEKPKQRTGALDKKGFPLHPARSVYYDATYNPTGVPPPGMPYAEREEESGSGSESGSDDIPMPTAPRPSGSQNEAVDDSDSDLDSDLDDIPMPAGPPPNAAIHTHTQTATHPQPTTEITEDERRKAAEKATISSAPQMRDLQKESAMLLPAQLVRKKK
ncbi:hypothetical protein E3P86_00393 [Wallemia ichthyophaga]|uniref:Wbp11/ELF5/Saf1 N-terminal domain-containing protein n=1 Tax=Wallemia ichthyophaga TaxID=245174 RepID=A0A4T0JJK0_WALIC|nr:hypothetical protein E3P86_00393 [Wallemia ichthyophaga]